MLLYCISVLSFLAAVPLDSLAETLSPRWEDVHTKHSWNAVPTNWESLGCPPNDTMIDLYIVLKPHRENSLIDALYEVSSPGHPRHVLHHSFAHARTHTYALPSRRYGAHLSKEQVAMLVAPHPETLELVNSWLEHYDIPSSSVSMTHGGSTLMLEGMSVTQADALLGTSYQVYRHVESSETIVRTVSYALPAVLHEHVLTVAPTTSFVSPRPRWQTPRNQSGGDEGGVVKPTSRGPATNLSSRDSSNSLTPSFLRSLYGTETYKPAAKGRNVLGIAGYLDDYPSPADLAEFLRRYRSDAADATLSVVQVNGGGYDPNQPNAEANLDTQYAEAMAYPTPVIFYSTGRGPRGTQDWYISWFRYILSQPRIPQTISTSYSTDESLCSKEYAMYVCRLFAQLGVRGVSVLFPSGDNGVGKDCVRDGSVRFNPEFPSTCTYAVFSCSMQVRVQEAHHMLFQVPGSPSLAERRATSRRLQRVSPAAASRNTFRARNTSNRPCPSSSRTWGSSIKAFSSAFSSIT